jgi:hypothetical protein
MPFYSRLGPIATGLLVIAVCQVAMAGEPAWWTNQKRACGLSPALAYNTWAQQGYPCHSYAPPVNNLLLQQQERQRQLELQRQQEEAERKRKAGEADQKGLDAANRGEWKTAADWFMAALQFAPESAEIRAHLDRANTALADAGTAAEILALHQRVENALAAADLQAMQQKLEDEEAARRLNAMYDNLQHSGDAARKPVLVSIDVNTPLFPVLLRRVPLNSPPAKVLQQYQPKIKDVDEEIHRAQEALRRLIESNSQSEDERLEWTKESEEATIDAQDLGVSLVIDLLGAHADHLAEVNGEERNEVLNHLLNRSQDNGRQNSIHAAFGMLMNRKDELDRLQSEIRLAGKENDLRVKISEFSVNKDTQFTTETFWDVITQFKKVEDLVGPSKDLLDSVYTIYRQAASFERLITIQSNQEKTLQASAALHRYIVRLEAQKKVGQPHAPGNKP